MTKNELAKEVAVSEKLHLSTAVKAVDGILRVMKQALATGENITSGVSELSRLWRVRLARLFTLPLKNLSLFLHIRP